MELITLKFTEGQLTDLAAAVIGDRLLYKQLVYTPDPPPAAERAVISSCKDWAFQRAGSGQYFVNVYRLGFFRLVPKY